MKDIMQLIFYVKTYNYLHYFRLTVINCSAFSIFGE